MKTINSQNYFENTFCQFNLVKSNAEDILRKEPDFISYKKTRNDISGKVEITSEISSRYWYTEKGIYRESNHWGRRIATCSWYLNEKKSKINGTQLAFAKWSNFKNLMIIEKDFIVNLMLLKNKKTLEINTTYFSGICKLIYDYGQFFLDIDGDNVSSFRTHFLKIN